MPHQIKHAVPESLFTEMPGHFCMVASGPEVTTVQCGGIERSLGPGGLGSTLDPLLTHWVTLGESLDLSEPLLPHP